MPLSLPPFVVTVTKPVWAAWAAGGLRFLLVGALHLALLFMLVHAAQRQPPEPEPPTLTVRLLPAVVQPTPPAPPVQRQEMPRPAPVRVQRLAPPLNPAPASPLVPAAEAPLAAATPLLSAPVSPVVVAAPSLTAARFDAAYLQNPRPVYPALSRRNGEEGRVLLRVRVTAAGEAAEVEVKESSGFARLDHAAREAVQKWRFVPARRGEQALESWVLVPMPFVLE